jgi:hypothetical protein
MPFTRTQATEFKGRCTLRFGAGRSAEAVCRLRSDPSQLRAGPKGIRGGCTLEPALAAEVFRALEGRLTLDDGSEFRFRALAYTEGDDTVYFELWR